MTARSRAVSACVERDVRLPFKLLRLVLLWLRVGLKPEVLVLLVLLLLQVRGVLMLLLLQTLGGRFLLEMGLDDVKRDVLPTSLGFECRESEADPESTSDLSRKVIES